MLNPICQAQARLRLENQANKAWKKRISVPFRLICLEKKPLVLK
jgi:hypothetical protein